MAIEQQRPVREPSPLGVSPRNQPQSPSLEAHQAIRPAIFVMCGRLVCEEQQRRALTCAAPRLAAGAIEALRILARLHMPIMLLMDQACVSQSEAARQPLTWRHERLVEEIEAQGGRCDALFVNTHEPREAGAYSMLHTDIFQQAAQMFNLDLTRSALICDTWEQACAALSVRCQPLLTLTARGRAEIIYPIWAEVRERVWYAADVVGAAQSIEATVLGQRLWRELHNEQTDALTRQRSEANSRLRAGL